MSSVAALTTPSETTKPGFTIYTESIVAKNSTTSGIITATDIESKSNLLVDAVTNLNLGTINADTVNIGNALASTKLLGSLTSNNRTVPIWRASLGGNGSNFIATTTETSVIGSQVGSLAIPPTLAAGFTLKLNNAATISLGAATTLTLRLKLNGNTILTSVIPAGVVVNQNINISITVSIRTLGNQNDVLSTYSIIRDGGASMAGSNLAAAAWILAGTNTISMTGQFSDTNGGFSGNTFDMFSSQTS